MKVIPMVNKLNVITCNTLEEKLRGVKGNKEFPENTIYVFPDTANGDTFHMRGVPFPLDIAFLDKNNKVLMVIAMPAEYGLAKAPKDTVKAIEAPLDFFKENKDFVKELEND